MAFQNRKDAGKRLATALLLYLDKDPIILALPRGGAPVAAEIANALDAPLDLVLVRKIGVPDQSELAMGAVVDGTPPIVVRNEDVIAASSVSAADFNAVLAQQLTEIERRRRRYLSGRKPLPVAGRTVILVDDGISTGATMRAAIRAVRARKPHLIVLAVPVAASDTLASLQTEVDKLVCLESHEAFGAIGAYYRDFNQTSDEEVIALLRASASRPRRAQNHAR